VVDVSGTVPGDREVRDLVLALLECVPEAVATDDYPAHGWRSEEIRDGTRIQGHCFFDYQGWYDENGC
jgi:hypothetical protein